MAATRSNSSCAASACLIQYFLSFLTGFCSSDIYGVGGVFLFSNHLSAMVPPPQSAVTSRITFIHSPEFISFSHKYTFATINNHIARPILRLFLKRRMWSKFTISAVYRTTIPGFPYQWRSYRSQRSGACCPGDSPVKRLVRGMSSWATIQGEVTWNTCGR